MRIKYCGRVFDASGYGEHARAFIAALHGLGLQVAVQNVRYGPIEPDLGPIGTLCRQLECDRSLCDVKLIHLTPDMFPKMREEGCLNVGYTVSETDRIPDRWVEWCNILDGVIVPTEWNRSVFERSGVRVPVRSAAPGIDAADFWAVTPEQPTPHWRAETLLDWRMLGWASRYFPLSRLPGSWFWQPRRSVGASCWVPSRRIPILLHLLLVRA